jgi:hypothetical protein
MRPYVGWNFGTVVNLTEENSAPQIEAAVLQKQSYGRQLGQITDALQVLITERAQTGKPSDAALDKFSTMKADIDRIKAAGVEARVEQLRNDLAALKKHDEPAYKRLHDELLSVLKE